MSDFFRTNSTNKHKKLAKITFIFNYFTVMDIINVNVTVQSTDVQLAPT